VSDAQGPETTPKSAASGRGAPRSGARRGFLASTVPIWVLAVALVAVAALSAGGAWVAMSGSLAAKDARIADLEKIAGDPEGASSMEATAPTGAPSGGTTTKPPPSGKPQFAFIDDITGDASKGFEATVIYAQLLWGKAAADAAKAAGDDPPPPAPGDWYIVEGNGDPVTLPLAADAKVIVLGWKGTAETAKATITAADFATVMPSGSGFAEEYLQGGYNVTATNGTITTIEQVYLP
jgi:hypothetical protein